MTCRQEKNAVYTQHAQVYIYMYICIEREQMYVYTYVVMEHRAQLNDRQYEDSISDIEIFTRILILHLEPIC